VVKLITENNALKTLIKTEVFFDTLDHLLRKVFPEITDDWTEEILNHLVASVGWTCAFNECCRIYNLTHISSYYSSLDWQQSENFDKKVANIFLIMISKDCNCIIKCYTPRWNNFQIRDVVYIDGHIDPNKFAVVKWCTHEPIEVTDMETGLKKTSKESCYTVANLEYSPEDNSFELHSCGMRFLNDYEEGLSEWIIEWCNEYIEARR
jgi:hypothetical protein